MKESKFEIHKLLNEIVTLHLDKKKTEMTNEALKEIPQPTNKLLPATVRHLDYYQSDDFFTAQYTQQIKNIIGKPEEFVKLPQKEKKKKQLELVNLTGDEYQWKSRVKRNINDPSFCALLFPEAFSNFVFHLSIFLDKKRSDKNRESQREYRRYFQFKLYTLLQNLGKVLVEEFNYPAFVILTSVTEQDIEIICKSYIEPEWIFNDLIRLISKKACNNVFNPEVRKTARYDLTLSDDALVVLKTAVVNDYVKLFTLYVINCTLNYLKKSRKISINIDRLSLLVKRFLYNRTSHYEYDKNVWWGVYRDSVTSIILILERSGVFELKINDKEPTLGNKLKSVTKYVLPIEAGNIDVKKTDLPQIALPDKITVDSLEDIIKPILFGSNNVSKSDQLKDTLNIAQSKPFSVSPTFLKLLKHLYKLDVKDVSFDYFNKLNLPFPFIEEINKIKEERFYFSEILPSNCINRDMFENLKDFFTGNNLVYYSHKLLSSSNFSTIDLELTKKFRDVADEHMKLKMSRAYAKTSITIGDLFSDIPLYISNILCARLRLYTAEPYISRTSGVYKPLLQDYKSLKLTENGLRHLLCAYYKPSDVYSFRFEDFLIQQSKFKGKKLMKLMYNFFGENPLNFSLSDNPLYFMHLHMEILISLRTGYTKVNIEIDQTASGVVFLALLTHNKSIASTCNLISKDFQCPYSYCMKRFEDFYTDRFENKDVHFEKFIFGNRKIHKYALMCWIYGQGYSGRVEDLEERWISTYKSTPSSEVKKSIEEFALTYENFLDFLFPNLIDQLDLIKTMVQVVAEESSSMKFRTLEGELIEYTFFKTKQRPRSGYDPITKKFLSYSTNVIMTDEKSLNVGVKKLIDIEAHKRKFLSYLIHSIDGGLMRRFLRIMHERHGYVCNHLHDCLIIHPNYAQEFFCLVDEIFSSDEIYNMMDHLVFDTLKSNLSLKTQDKFEVLIKRFKSLTDDFKDLIEINPKNLYQYEK